MDKLPEVSQEEQLNILERLLIEHAEDNARLEKEARIVIRKKDRPAVESYLVEIEENKRKLAELRQQVDDLCRTLDVNLYY